MFMQIAGSCIGSCVFETAAVLRPMRVDCERVGEFTSNQWLTKLCWLYFILGHSISSVFQNYFTYKNIAITAVAGTFKATLHDYFLFFKYCNQEMKKLPI